MLLTKRELEQLITDGVVRNATPDLVNQTSMDVTLGNTILIEQSTVRSVNFRSREPLLMRTFTMDPELGYLLDPGEFILAQCEQMFYLPLNISAEYKLKSSMARIGLEHLNAGWCDPGWHGSVLTMELKNMTRYHTIQIRPGDRIGQMIFFHHNFVEQGYSGRYNNDTSVKGIKP